MFISEHAAHINSFPVVKTHRVSQVQVRTQLFKFAKRMLVSDRLLILYLILSYYRDMNVYHFLLCYHDVY